MNLCSAAFNKLFDWHVSGCLSFRCPCRCWLAPFWIVTATTSATYHIIIQSWIRKHVCLLSVWTLHGHRLCIRLTNDTFISFQRLGKNESLNSGFLCLDSEWCYCWKLEGVFEMHSGSHNMGLFQPGHFFIHRVGNYGFHPRCKFDHNQ